MSEIGHNSGVAADELKSFVERIEKLEKEKASLGVDIREVMAEAKGRGYDTKALRAILKIRKQDAGERAEHQALVDLYASALGIFA